ncbi:MAG: hypothetical protein MUD08_02820 [Cytophagales bacterium]|jgi:hypothetical protein|nr:hypothetical protein [Cytophagales bacterium]
MATTAQELKEICSRMDQMRNLINQNPRQATELFYEHPELYGQIKEIVALLREWQQDMTDVNVRRTNLDL